MNEHPEELTPAGEELPIAPDHRAFTFALALTGILFLCFVAIAAPMQALHPPYGLWFTQLSVILGVTWMALRRTGRHPLHYPRTGVPGGKVLLIAFLAGCLNFLAIVLPVQFVVLRLLPDSITEAFNAAQLFERQRPIDLGFIVAAIGFGAPICEEYFFRGVLLRGMTASGMRAAKALFVSAVIFSAFHVDLVGFIQRLELGILFGFLYLRTGSLWPAVMAHAANNLVSTTLYFIAESAGADQSTAEEPTLIQAAFLLLAFGLPLFLSVNWFARRGPMLPSGPDVAPPGLRAREVSVWLGGTLVSFALLLAIDGRTVAVNASEVWIRVAQPKESAPAEQHAEFEALEELGGKARRGEIPVDEYISAREAANRKQKAEQERQPQTTEPRPPVPVPVPTPPVPGP